jgi:hypothetical protein
MMSRQAAWAWRVGAGTASPAVCALTALALACAAPGAAAREHAARTASALGHTNPSTSAYNAELGGFQPLTPWLKPPVELPPAQPLNYQELAEAGVKQAVHWRHGGWYCEYLGCTHGPYPLITIWGEVPMFESVDALETASPSPAHRALVDRFGRANERYWDRALGGYAPYPGDRAGNVQAFFDDNGWEGLAFLDAYKATGEARWLRDAQRAFHFIAARGWDSNGGGGMWWNTSHPYHSGPALAADSLLGILLYGEDHERWQLEDVKMYVDWGNANDANDERQLYLEQPNRPESVNDYVQAPLIYAQYLLCQDGEGESYCVRAGRVASTMAEQDANGFGYEYQYGPEYDAVFMQWMMAYGRATGEGYWLRLAEVNAGAAATNVAGRGLWLSGWWGGAIPDPETHPGMFRTMAATTRLFAWVGVYSGGGG